MKSEELFTDCKLIKLDQKQDNRGYFCRLAESIWFPELQNFKQISLSTSKENYTLRGMHFQKSLDSEWKIVNVISGSIYDVLVDLRPDSDTYLQYWSCEISESNPWALVISPGFAHGFMTMSPHTIVHYSMSKEFDKSNYSGIMWNDPKLQIDWPHEPLRISEQDKNWELL
jgi:dTDP-4-dehydrorhamnose 3,5-epimerase